jgi:hypothetical protein
MKGDLIRSEDQEEDHESMILEWKMRKKETIRELRNPNLAEKEKLSKGTEILDWNLDDNEAMEMK